MAEATGEGKPRQHNSEAKKATAPQHPIDSVATPRQQPTESKEDLHAKILQRRQRIEELVKDSEKLLEGAIKFPDLSQPTPSKNIEQKKPGIRGRISEMVKGIVGRSKSTQPPLQK